MTSRPAWASRTLSTSYSRGVRWTARPPTVTSWRATSSVNGPGASRPRDRRRDPPRAQHGPQPGAQLGDAERLGQVVVGAGLERRDLRRSSRSRAEGPRSAWSPRGAPGGSRPIPSTSGRPRSRSTRSGRWAFQRSSAAGRITGLARPDNPCSGQVAADLAPRRGIVLDEQDEGAGGRTRRITSRVPGGRSRDTGDGARRSPPPEGPRPPPGRRARSARALRAAHRLQQPANDGQAEPVPRREPRRSAAPGRTSRTGAAGHSGGTPGPPSSTVSRTVTRREHLGPYSDGALRPACGEPRSPAGW